MKTLEPLSDHMPGFLLVYDTASTHVASVQFLDDKSTDAIDWSPHYPELILIENHWDIMYQRILNCLVAPQTVQ